MGFLGLAAVYMMRINLSVAIVDMVITQPKPPLNETSFFGRNGRDESVDTQCEDDSETGGEVQEICQMKPIKEALLLIIIALVNQIDKWRIRLGQ